MYSFGSTITTNSSLRPNMNPIRAVLRCIGPYKNNTYDLIHLLRPSGEGRCGWIDMSTVENYVQGCFYPPTRGGKRKSKDFYPPRIRTPGGEKQIFTPPGSGPLGGERSFFPLHLGGKENLGKPAAGGKFWGFGPLEDSNPFTENAFPKCKSLENS